MVNVIAYESAMKKLWNDRCDVIIKKNIKDARTGKTKQADAVVLRELPCRLSFKTVTIPTQTDSAARTVQSTVLFLSKDVTVPPGSKIVVTHEGVKREYTQSGVPSVYSYQQEIPVELKGEWV